MSITDGQGAELTTLKADIATLKRDVARLVEHLTTGATSGAQRAASQIEDRSRRLYRTASAESGEAARAIGRRIEKEPMMALLIVLGVAWIGCRLLSR